MADNALFIAASAILAVFDIKKAVDENGREIAVAERFTGGFMVCVVYIEPFHRIPR
jgi:hypothetical protein